MPVKRNKRKAHTGLKREALLARSRIKNLCIAMVLGTEKYCTVMNYKTFEEVLVSRREADLIANLPWKWHIECSVICRKQQGQEYVVSEAIQCESHYRQSDPRLNDFLNTHHKAFLAKQNPLHVVTLAWVAVPVLGEAIELELDTLSKIYTQLGAFDYLSKWENDNKMTTRRM